MSGVTMNNPDRRQAPPPAADAEPDDFDPRACPNCGSTAVEPDQEHEPAGLYRRCNDCDYLW